MKSLTFGERLLEAMSDQRLQQADLARACNITRSAIHQALSGKTKGMKPENLVKVCRRLNIRPEWLALGEEPKRPLPISPQDLLILRALQSIPESSRHSLERLVMDMASLYQH